MIDIGQIGRLLRITRIFVKHDLDEFVRTIHLFRPYRLFLRLLPWRWWRHIEVPRGKRLREALEELGPVFVKFGQVLSTRPDLLPDDIAAELAKLQDQVPPFAGEQATTIIESSLGGKIADFFSEFSKAPLASASVAQVHAARMRDGKEVVVKVLRPGIEPVIERDLALLDTLAHLAVRYWSEGRRLRPVEVVDEFRKTLHDELDLRVEAGNASQLRANFAASPLLYVPQVYWDLVRRQVMVMERIHGIPVSDIEALKRAGIDLRTLSHHGVEIFFTQAFRDGFFHADMHPGNIFVYPDGRYCAVDFGIMGTLSEKDKRYLAENFLAFFNRDYRGVAEAHLRSGWVPAGTRAEEFETAIRAVCEPIFAKPIKDISFGRFLLQLFQTARRFQMEIQPQLVLLQKTLFNIEGLGRRLYPELDLWDTAKPYLERWMRDQLGPRAFFRTLRREAPKWWELMPQLPVLVHETLRRATAGDLSLEWRSRELEALSRQMRRNYRRLYFAMAGGAMLISAILLIGTGAGGPFDSWRDGAGWVAGIVGIGMLWRTWPGRESG